MRCWGLTRLLKRGLLCLCVAGTLALPASSGFLRPAHCCPGSAVEPCAAVDDACADAPGWRTGTLPEASSAGAPPADTTASPAASAQHAAFSPENAAAYFEEIAFASEYGGDCGAIRKWTRRASLHAQGNCTVEDMAALHRAMQGINAVDGFPGISLTNGLADIEVYFVPLDEMGRYVPGYVQDNWGFFETTSDAAGISGARIAIASDVTSQTERNHLIFEELLQSVGLMQDSSRYEDSIFYGGWTTVQQPSALDWELLRLLYLPQVAHGMAQRDAMTVAWQELGLK